MAYIFSDVRAALESYLLLLPTLPFEVVPLVQWENHQFEPIKNRGWLATTLLVAESYGRSLGKNPTVRMQGIFQVSVFTPQGAGPGNADALADEIMRHYKSGTRLSANGREVTTIVPGRSAGFVDSIWYHVPVTVGWYTHVEDI